MSIDQIKKQTIGLEPKIKEELFVLKHKDLPNDVQLLLRQPTIALAEEIRKRSSDDQNRIDISHFNIWCIIYLVFDPETKERVYDETHFESFLNQAQGGWVNELSIKCMDFYSGSVDEKKRN